MARTFLWLFRSGPFCSVWDVKVGGRLRTEMSSFLLCLGEQRKQIGFAEGDLKCGDVVCVCVWGGGVSCKSPAGQSSGVVLMFGCTGSPDSGPGNSKPGVLSSGLWSRSVTGLWC